MRVMGSSWPSDQLAAITNVVNGHAAKLMDGVNGQEFCDAVSAVLKDCGKLAVTRLSMVMHDTVTAPSMNCIFPEDYRLASFFLVEHVKNGKTFNVCILHLVATKTK